MLETFGGKVPAGSQLGLPDLKKDVEPVQRRQQRSEPGAPLPWRQTERAGVVQPGEGEAPGRS